jgi:V8-like Glu-specific endopeptidase
MKKSFLRHSPLIIGLLILTMVFVAVIGAPNGVLAVPAQVRNQMTPLTTHNNICDVVTSQEDSIPLTSSQQPWTLARMQAAQPYPIPSHEFSPSSTLNPQQPAGDSVYIPSEPPQEFSPASEEQIPGTLSSAESLLGYDYPAPYTRFENFDDYTVFPYSTTGVLFFTQNGSDFRCSAASIGNNALWTAGHCVHDGFGSKNSWSTNLIFVPAYKDGSMPFGSWTSNNVATCSSWRDNRNFQVDIGGVLLEENSSGQTVNEVVGSLGFAYNLSPNQHWFSLGYPSATPFDGKTMQICAASFARYDLSSTFPFPMAIGCDMTKGSSGGPWIIDFSGSPGNTNYINGNNSYRYDVFGEEMYSPYLGEQAKELLDFLSSETRIKTNILLPFITTAD